MKLSRIPEYISAARTLALLRLDAARWKHQTAPLRHGRKVGPAPRKVMFCDLYSMIAGAKMQALFADALIPHGFTPVVLMNRPDRAYERIYEALGPVRFIYLDDFIDEALRKRSKLEADGVIGSLKNPGDLLSYQRGEVRNGRNVLSRVLRLFRCGRLDGNSSVHWDALRFWLTESIICSEAFQRIIEAEGFEKAIFLERGYTPAGEIFDLCLINGVDTVQWLGAPQADHLLFKRFRVNTRDQHPLALSDKTWEYLLQQPWTTDNDNSVMRKLTGHYKDGTWFNRQQLQEGKAVKSAEETIKNLGLDPKKKTAVIFSHILYDATFFYGDSVFADYEQWLIEAVRGAIANKNLNWVVKVHPVNVWRSRMDGVAMEQLEVSAIHRAFGELPPHVHILPADTDINTFSLFSFIDYGLTVRGTIGLELPCFGIPVVTAGTGRYSGRGFTCDPATPVEFQRLLARLHEIPKLDEETARRARRYAYGTFFERPIRMESFVLDYHANTFWLPSLGTNVRPKGSTQFTETGKDLRRIAAWIAECDDDDLLIDDIGGRFKAPRAMSNAAFLANASLQ